MTKLDLRKKMLDKRGQRPNKFAYRVLQHTLVPCLYKPMNPVIIDNVGTDTLKPPFVILSNHTSRCDWMYVATAFKKQIINFMASYTEFFREHLHFVFDLMKVIPKKNFVSDVNCIKQVLQVVKQRGILAFFPEGKSSISGTNQPVMKGTGKLLKHMNIPVYTTTISGGYMSNTQWNIANRPGKVEIRVNKLFDKGDTEKFSADEIEDKINDALYNDDFLWNKTARVKFAGNDTVADKLEEHIFYCPKCGKEFTMKGKGNAFRCENCGNGATINEYYDLIPFNDTCVIPKDLRVWYELQRRKLYREIKANKDFTLTEEVDLGVLPNDRYVDKLHTSVKVGEGKLTLTRENLSFTGVKDGKPFSFTHDIKDIPSMLFETDSSYFGAFINGEYYEFTPHRPSSTKWQIATEECHRAAGGKWQNNLPAQQWIYEEDKPDDKEKYFL